MPTLPMLDIKRNSCESPHVVLLGAGASLASCPNGDANGRRLPLMTNLVEVVGLNDVISRAGVDPNISDFESFYDHVVTSGKHKTLVSELEEAIRSYFADLKLPDSPTLYDYLVLSLRKKDIIATFNWDPFLAQAFRRNMHLKEMPRIVFLHGNVAVGLCRDHQAVGFLDQRCATCGCALLPSPLLYPVGSKDYSSDPYIKSEWNGVRDHIEHAYFVTIFGYSAPVSDREARELMLEVWRKNPTRDLAQFDVIDIKSKRELDRTWHDFKEGNNFGCYKSLFETSMLIHPRRSCDAFAMATLQQNPWRENPWPRFDSLSEMQEWIKPIVDEESSPRLSGRPCPSVS